MSLAFRLRSLGLFAGAIGIATSLMLENAIGDTTQYTYDALGRVTSVIYGNGTGVKYTYDAAGNRIEVVTPIPPAPPPPPPPAPKPFENWLYTLLLSP